MFSPEPVPVLVADAAAAQELAFEAGGTPGDRVTSGHRQDGPAAMTHAWDPLGGTPGAISQHISASHTAA